MPRRAPPTPLRLVPGPTPLRNRPKYTLPSLPRPAFYPHPAAALPRAPRPRTRSHSIDELLPADTEDLQAHIVVHMPSVWGLGHTGAGVDSAASSPVSSPGSRRGSESGSRPVSPQTRSGDASLRRGPWDHSGCIKVPFDVGAVLAPPRPAVLNVGLVR